MDWPTIAALVASVLGGQGFIQYLSERRINRSTANHIDAQAESSSVQASERAVDLAIKMMERLNTELESEKRARILLLEYVKELRNAMIDAGIPVGPMPRELRELGL